jgi:hypothetical protein
LEQLESLTCTDTPLTLVASHLLLLKSKPLLLQEYAPTYSTLIAPPYEFAPRASAKMDFGSKLTCVIAVQSTDVTCRTRTSTPITSVAPHVLLLLFATLLLQLLKLEASLLILQEYAPTYSTLIAPPYEFAPNKNPMELLTALQLEQLESLTCTDTPLTLVASHLLLLKSEPLPLQEYAPTYSTLIAPPYEFAPRDCAM